MSENSLKNQIIQLQQALADHPDLDAESHAALQKIAVELNNMGVRAEPELSDLVQAQALHFEQDYPTLAAVLRQIVDTLGRMGV
jgi:hypothetical protein